MIKNFAYIDSTAEGTLTGSPSASRFPGACPSEPQATGALRPKIQIPSFSLAILPFSYPISGPLFFGYPKWSKDFHPSLRLAIFFWSTRKKTQQVFQSIFDPLKASCLVSGLKSFAPIGFNAFRGLGDRISEGKKSAALRVRKKMLADIAQARSDILRNSPLRPPKGEQGIWLLDFTKVSC